MRLRATYFLFICFLTIRLEAADVYGSATTAQSIALDGNYLGSFGPTDALASNPALLTSVRKPYVEFTGMGILAGGDFHNATPTVGHLQNNAGVAGSAGFGMQIPRTHLSVGAGIFPVSLLSDRWLYQDPAGTAGATYGLQNNKSAFLALQSGFGLGWQFTPRLSIGAGFGLVDNLNTLEAPYIFQVNPTLAGLKTLLHLHTSGVGYNGTFGLVASPVHRLQIGVSYKTQTTVRSTGEASGNANVQLLALGLTNPSVFHYRAEVDNVFPQSASVSAAWQLHRRVRTFVQGDWLNWSHAFRQLPVHLTDGDNALLNALLQSTSLNDAVPLHWKNQLTVRTGVELSATEAVSFQAGYSHGNSPVPASTLTPLTAALMKDTLSTGLAYTKNRYRVQFAYQVNLPTTESVGASSLLAGEYSNTRTSLWLQTLALTTGVRF